MEAAARRGTADAGPFVIVAHIDGAQVCEGEFAGERFTVPRADLDAYLEARDFTGRVILLSAGVPPP
jgi:hypothetical protein